MLFCAPPTDRTEGFVPVQIGGSSVHSSDASGCALWPGVRDLVSAKSLAPGVLARDDWLRAVAVEEGHLPCRGRPDRGGLRRWVPAAVVSHHGRGVLDLASGNVLAR